MGGRIDQFVPNLLCTIAKRFPTMEENSQKSRSAGHGHWLAVKPKQWTLISSRREEPDKATTCHNSSPSFPDGTTHGTFTAWQRQMPIFVT
jgi:hypothetical protein